MNANTNLINFVTAVFLRPVPSASSGLGEISTNLQVPLDVTQKRNIADGSDQQQQHATSKD